jgi:hypothetical protein
VLWFTFKISKFFDVVSTTSFSIVSKEANILLIYNKIKQ